MADIPVISITQVVDNESHDEDDTNERRNSDGKSMYDIHTDVEDLDGDNEGVTKRVHRTKKKRTLATVRLNARKMPVRQSIDAAVTDVEDCNDSGSDDADSVVHVSDSEFSMNEFLDQGYFNESMTSSNATGGRTGTNQTAGCAMLIVDYADLGCVTDCDNIETSDEEAELSVPTPEKYNDFLLDNDLNGSQMNETTIHDSMSIQDGRISRCKTSLSAYNSEIDEAKRLQCAISDFEQMLFSEDDDNYCGALKPSISAFDVQEVYMQSSDAEDDQWPRSRKVSIIPDIDISFTSAERGCGLRNRKNRKIVQQRRCSLMLPGGNDDIYTDVENLNSSDDDEVNLSHIPAAYVMSDAVLTDVEDFDGDAEEDICISYRDIRMPSPLREMTLVKEDATGAPISKVMPMLEANFLQLDDAYIDKGLTDTEEMSGNEEDFDDTSRFDIESVPDIDGGVVRNSESVRPIPKTYKKNRYYCEPKTDTEDLNSAIAPVASGVRRRKTKNKSSTPKGRLLLDPRGLVYEQPETDCEELDIDDDRNVRGYALVSRHLTPFVADTADDAITDTELLSGEEPDDENQSDIDPSLLSNESFFSTVVARDCCSKNGRHTTFTHFEVPKIQRIESASDSNQAFTDSEDIQTISDTDEFLGVCANSRPDTVTPIAMTIALEANAGGGSMVIDKNVSYFDMSNEEMHQKGQQETQDVVTDSEFLDDDGVVGAQ